MLFSFKDSIAATTWVMRSMTPADSASLPTGNLVPQPAWLHMYGNDGEIANLYEYQFARGRYVCDVGIWSPFDVTKPESADAARKLAEEWYRLLMGGGVRAKNRTPGS